MRLRGLKALSPASPAHFSLAMVPRRLPRERSRSRSGRPAPGQDYQLALASASRALRLMGLDPTTTGLAPCQIPPLFVAMVAILVARGQEDWAEDLTVEVFARGGPPVTLRQVEQALAMEQAMPQAASPEAAMRRSRSQVARRGSEALAPPFGHWCGKQLFLFSRSQGQRLREQRLAAKNMRFGNLCCSWRLDASPPSWSNVSEGAVARASASWCLFGLAFHQGLAIG